MNENAPPRLKYPWFVALVAAQPERAKTALEDALRHALEKALYNPRHPCTGRPSVFTTLPRRSQRACRGATRGKRKERRYELHDDANQ